MSHFMRYLTRYLIVVLLLTIPASLMMGIQATQVENIVGACVHFFFVTAELTGLFALVFVNLYEVCARWQKKMRTSSESPPVKDPAKAWPFRA